MKKILLALFVMCSALSFSAKVINSSNIEVKGNVIYEAGQKAPYTGVLENYNEKGIVDAKNLDKDYEKTKINRRDKVDDLPDAKVVKENPPVQDELYINHRTKK